MDIYATRALDFVERLRTLTDYDEICEEISREFEWFGLSYVTIVDLVGTETTLRSGVLMNTRSEQYLDHYEENDLIHKDPVVTELKENLNCFSWSDIIQTRDLSDAQRNIILDGREFGMRNGFIIPIISPSGRYSIVSPAGENPNLSDRARVALEMIGMYAHQALERSIISSDRESRPIEPLSSRQRDVVSWAALGKTDPEIAEILGVAQSTVTDHIRKAKSKLDAHSRTFMVVRALRLGEIYL